MYQVQVKKAHRRTNTDYSADVSVTSINWSVCLPVAQRLFTTRPISRMAITLLVCMCATILPTCSAGELQLQWGSQYATSSAQLFYEETSRVPTPEGMGVTYKLRTLGLPKEKTYSLWGKWLNGRTIEMYKALRIDDSGRVMHEDGTEFEYGLKKMLEGESIEYGLISTDESDKAFIEITPFPIIGQGKGGACQLSAKLGSAKGEFFVIQGEGFTAGQELKVVANSNGETGKFPVKANNGGPFSLVVAPAVVGKSGGEASVTVSDNICSATVRFKWGDAMKVSGEEHQNIPLPTDSFLQDKVLKVGQALKWSLAYENREEGLFAWYFKFKPQIPDQTGKECEGLFIWYIKRAGNDIALDDPVIFIPGCSQKPEQLANKAKALQKEFKQRWRELVGPVILTGPTPATHSSKLEGQLIARLIKERSESPVITTPDGTALEKHE